MWDEKGIMPNIFVPQVSRGRRRRSFNTQVPLFRKVSQCATSFIFLLIAGYSFIRLFTVESESKFFLSGLLS